MNKVGRDPAIDYDVLCSLLRPIISHCLRRSQPIQDFQKAAKEVFVRVAAEELSKSDAKKAYSTQISVITGVYREEVRRILNKKKEEPEEERSIIYQVIGRWRHDPRFTTKAGKPRVLSIGGEDSEFAQLVRAVNSTQKSGTVLAELKRQGYVEKTSRGLKLLKQLWSYQTDPRATFELVSRDLGTLLSIAEENLLDIEEVDSMQMRTSYDNVTKEDLNEIRLWLIDQAKVFHRKAREFISKFDVDIHPELSDKEGGAEVVLTSFGLTTPPSSLKDKSEE